MAKELDNKELPETDTVTTEVVTVEQPVSVDMEEFKRQLEEAAKEGKEEEEKDPAHFFMGAPKKVGGRERQQERVDG